MRWLTLCDGTVALLFAGLTGDRAVSEAKRPSDQWVASLVTTSGIHDGAPVPGALSAAALAGAASPTGRLDTGCWAVVQAATLAPSVHDSQPWTLVRDDGAWTFCGRRPSPAGLGSRGSPRSPLVRCRACEPRWPRVPSGSTPSQRSCRIPPTPATSLGSFSSGSRGSPRGLDGCASLTSGCLLAVKSLRYPALARVAPVGKCLGVLGLVGLEPISVDKLLEPFWVVVIHQVRSAVEGRRRCTTHQAELSAWSSRVARAARPAPGRLRRGLVSRRRAERRRLLVLTPAVARGLCCDVNPTGAA